MRKYMLGSLLLAVVATVMIAGCPVPHQLGLVDQLVADPSMVNSVTVTDNSESVDFYHPATVDIDGQTGNVHIVGGDGGTGAGGGPTININHTIVTGQPTSQPATPRVSIMSVALAPPADGENYYSGEELVFTVRTDADGEIHFKPEGVSIAADYTTIKGEVIISYWPVSGVGTDREPGTFYFWPQDRETEVSTAYVVIRRRVAH